MKAPTPMLMPSTVSALRSLWRARARSALRTTSVRGMRAPGPELRPRAELSDEFDEGGNDRAGRFLHQPVTDAGDDSSGDIGRHELRLLDQERAARLLSRQDEHRHGEAGSRQEGEVLGVALEGSEILEAGPHGAGLRIGLGIEPTIGLGNRALGIGGEVIPEMLQV